MPSPALKHIPNQLTLLRLVLAAAFFAVLSFYQHGQSSGALLLAGIVLFTLAALSDALDGFLARRWKVESTFGRIMDPFCDKVLILGAFAYLAGPGFTVSVPDAGGVAHVSITGVYPWMVVVVLARELLVTAIRGAVERQGIKFGANWWGKAKMILQSIVVPIVLVIVMLLAGGQVSDAAADALGWLRDILVYTTVAVTALSGIPYVTGARRALRPDA